MTPDVRATTPLEGPYDVVHSLASLSIPRDPTYRHGSGVVSFSGRTPEGPMAVQVTTVHGDLQVDAWGPGAGWITARADHLAAGHDDPRPLRFGHPVLDETNRRHPGVRHAATGLVVDGLLGRVLGQRVLSREAGASWAALCREFGGEAPGPLGLLLPPDPARISVTPTWWFHQHGIDRGRATTLVAVARHADRLAEVVDLPLAEAYRRMRSIPGLGAWTVNGVARAALGDPDAIILGDYWIAHGVCSFFTGAPRGSDEEMLRLVAGWTGQRGRVERLVGLSGHRLQRFAPGRPTPRIGHL